MDLLHFINTYWQILSGIVSVVAVFSWTKFKTDNHNDRIIRLETKHEELNNKLFEEITKLREDISFIKGALEVKK